MKRKLKLNDFMAYEYSENISNYYGVKYGLKRVKNFTKKFAILDDGTMCSRTSNKYGQFRSIDEKFIEHYIFADDEIFNNTRNEWLVYYATKFTGNKYNVNKSIEIYQEHAPMIQIWDNHILRNKHKIVYYIDHPYKNSQYLICHKNEGIVSDIYLADKDMNYIYKANSFTIKDYNIIIKNKEFTHEFKI